MIKHNIWCNDEHCFDNVQCPINWAYQDYIKEIKKEYEGEEE